MFSPNETKVLKILGSKKMTVSEIVKKFYKTEHPENARIIIGNYLKRITNKCKKNKSIEFTIKDDSGIGCKGRTVWQEKK